MQKSRMLVLATTAAMTAVLVGCNPFHRSPVTEVSRDVNANARWQASLVSPAALAGAVQINGAAVMQPGRNAGSTDFSLTLDNATPGGVHPWQVHRGQCGSDYGIVGSPTAYRAISIGDDGRGKATATVPMTTPTTGDYFVTVAASVANSETVVACGNLAAPTT